MNEDQRPVLLVIAGPNGSGKTTLVDKLLKSGIDLGYHINPDQIADRVPSPSYDQRVRSAQTIAAIACDRHIKSRESFSFETVMSHPSKLRVMEKARQKGFFIMLYFVGVDNPVINVERVAARVRMGGHDVPRDKIVSRWYRTMNLLAEAIALTDHAYIFDNSNRSGPREVSEWTRYAGLEIVERASPVPPWVKYYVFDRLAQMPPHNGD